MNLKGLMSLKSEKIFIDGYIPLCRKNFWNKLKNLIPLIFSANLMGSEIKFQTKNRLGFKVVMLSTKRYPYGNAIT